MTAAGGTGGSWCWDGCGLAYRIMRNRNASVLYTFTGVGNGANPAGALLNVGGTFYGTTTNGGSRGYGTVFSLSKAGKQRVLYSFKGGGDGGHPNGGLTDVDGVLYGTAGAGPGEHGTIFRIARR